MSEVSGEQRVTGKLTNRQREWFDHLKRCEASGETMKGYAKLHQLSVHAMYQAAKDLRQRGALAPSVRSRRNKGASFVRVSAPPATATSWRVRFTSGAVLEGSGTLSRELLAALVAGLSASR